MVRLQPIAEKLIYDLQAATGQEIELIDRHGRPVAVTSPRLRRLLEEWTAAGWRWGDGAPAAADASFTALVQELAIQGETVGYLALGGAPEVVRTLSHTARWIAESLIKEYSDRPGQITPADLRRSYFEDILFVRQTRQAVCLKAATANINPEECCHVAVVRLWYDVLEGADLQTYREALEHLTGLLEEFCRENPNVVCLSAQDKRVLISGNVRLLHMSIRQFAEVVEKKCGGRFLVYAGISNRSFGHYNLSKCDESAVMICDRLADQDHRILEQDACRLELLMEQMSSATKQEFVDQVFGDCPEEDVEEWARIVSVLTRNNGSINRSATELFMHKNTLQYRLMRIKERIGLDARVSQDALVLQIAFMARRSVKNEKLRRLGQEEKG